MLIVEVGRGGLVAEASGRAEEGAWRGVPERLRIWSRLRQRAMDCSSVPRFCGVKMTGRPGAKDRVRSSREGPRSVRKQIPPGPPGHAQLRGM